MHWDVERLTPDRFRQVSNWDRHLFTVHGVLFISSHPKARPFRVQWTIAAEELEYAPEGFIVEQILSRAASEVARGILHPDNVLGMERLTERTVLEQIRREAMEKCPPGIVPWLILVGDRQWQTIGGAAILAHQDLPTSYPVEVPIERVNVPDYLEVKVKRMEGK